MIKIAFKLYKLLAIVSLTLSSSCAPNLGIDLLKEQSGYRYSLSENGCATGEHQFSGREAMCDGLKNDSLNNNCAENLRRLKFQSDCPDRTW